ncbi:MAG: phosphatase PAP2 family protein [Chloroflexia bacterium]|nr:phosphatase PAP2 family protein [Chloroflexia bacterium]
MEPILEWGLEVILWLQQFSPALDAPFKVLTFLGEEEFFLILLPLLFWCIDRRIGIRLILVFFFSTYINAAVKELCGQPRPDLYAPQQVQVLYEAGGYGFPSGHTQTAVVIWGYLAARFRRSWLWVLAGLLMVLIPLSRMYLGVHFPSDVLGGYLIGLAVLLLYLWLEPRSSAWLAQLRLGWQLALAAGLPLLMILLFLTADGVKIGAALLGMAVGFVLERRWIGFAVQGAWWKRVLRFLLGAAGLAALYGGLNVAFSGLEPELLFRFLRYGLVGLWATLGVPWLFVRLGLSDPAD